MAKYKRIPIDIYKREVLVFIGSHEEFKKWAEEYFSFIPSYFDFLRMISNSDGTAQASTYFNEEDGTVIIEIPSFPKSPTDIAYVVHEIMHAVFDICNYCKVEYIVDGANEPFTYLGEFIANRVFDKDNNYKDINYDISTRKI